MLNYRTDLEEEREVIKQTDKEKSQMIEELTEQNQRLTAQLKEVGCLLDQKQSLL